MNESPDHRRFIEAARGFVPVALEFCELFEGEPFVDELWVALETLLPRLYLGGVALADAAPDDAFTYAEEGEQEFDIVPRLRDDAIAERCDAWASALAGDELIPRFVVLGWLSADGDEEPEPDYDVRVDRLSDLLGGMYTDLAGGLVLFESGLDGAAMIAAQDWLYAFYAGWGEWLPDLLKAVHSRMNTDPGDVDLEAAP